MSLVLNFVLFVTFVVKSLFCTTIVQILRALRKFSGNVKYSNAGIDSRQGAKHAKFGGKR
jgi:hypothetical protein